MLPCSGKHFGNGVFERGDRSAREETQIDDPEAAAKFAFRIQAYRHRRLSDELRDLYTELERFMRSVATA